MQMPKSVIFAWIQHVDSILFQGPDMRTPGASRRACGPGEYLVQFYNQANPGSNKYLFWLMKKFKIDPVRSYISYGHKISCFAVAHF